MPARDLGDHRGPVDHATVQRYADLGVDRLIVMRDFASMTAVADEDGNHPISGGDGAVSWDSAERRAGMLKGTTVILDSTKYAWREIKGDPASPYPIHHDLCILGYDRDAGTIDLMIRFDDKGGHCQAHRHITTTSVLVLEGEQHLDELRPGGERVHKVRTAGTHHLTPGDAWPHLERGGPEGAVLFFSHHTTDGRLYEIVDLDGTVVHTVTLDSLVASWENGV